MCLKKCCIPKLKGQLVRRFRRFTNYINNFVFFSQRDIPVNQPTSIPVPSEDPSDVSDDSHLTMFLVETKTFDSKITTHHISVNFVHLINSVNFTKMERSGIHGLRKYNSEEIINIDFQYFCKLLGNWK